MPLAPYRVHPNNMSKNFERMFQARMHVIDKHLPKNGNDPEIRERRRCVVPGPSFLPQGLRRGAAPERGAAGISRGIENSPC